MKTIKHLAVAGLLGGSALVSAPAMAGELTGNAGVMSDYLFRGLEQSSGASVYGGLDYADESGFYIGTWAASINFATGTNGDSAIGGGGAEVDVYAGYSGGDAVTYDLGFIYYWYSEEDEAPGANPDPSLNTPEIYGSLGFGPISWSAYYAPDTYFGVDDSAYGTYLSGSMPLTDVLSLDAAVGYNGGDGNAGFLPMDDDEYIEYNLGVSAGLDNGFGFSFGFVGTDIDNDDPKIVVDASYAFDLQ